MPNPKRRHSTSRQNKRRANWKLSAPKLVICPQCKQPKLPHFLCDNCGYYNGVEIIDVEKLKEKKLKKKAG
jgi:large subunit ribosomal protein L32